MANETVDKIVLQAEAYIRTQGYNGFSFRDIAKDIGIKSASIHYHFPSKSDLAQEVAKRYVKRFFTALEEAQEQGKTDIEQLQLFISLFRNALENDEKMCLCGMIAAELDGLPAAVVTEAKTFFKCSLVWLNQVIERIHAAYPAQQRLASAETILSTLEGALLLARIMKSPELFTQATAALEDSLAKLSSG